MTALVKQERIRVGTLSGVYELADRLARARGFVPDIFIGQPAALAAAMLLGDELGMGPMEALRSIHVIKGKPCMSAETMLSRALQAGIGCEWTRSDDKCATLQITRGGAKKLPVSFTIEDASRAGLGGDNWRKYPAAMLRARCTSAALRMHCPDVLGPGIYTPEELGAPVRVSDEGVIDVEPTPAEARQEEPRLPPSTAPKTIKECTTQEQAMEWIAENVGRLAAHPARARAAIDETSARLRIDPRILLDAAGMLEAPRVDEGEVSASEEPSPA